MNFRDWYVGFKHCVGKHDWIIDAIPYGDGMVQWDLETWRCTVCGNRKKESIRKNRGEDK